MGLLDPGNGEVNGQFPGVEFEMVVRGNGEMLFSKSLIQFGGLF
jgi:hypothetical protein